MPSSPENKDSSSKKSHKNLALLQRDEIFRKHRELLPDITVTVENRNYRVNKDMLASFSPYFNAMFNRSFMESKLSSVKLLEMASEPFEVLLNFMSGKDPEFWFTERTEECWESVLVKAVDLADKICVDLFLGYYDEELDHNLENFDLSLAFQLGGRLGKRAICDAILKRVMDSLMAKHYRTTNSAEHVKVYQETNYELLCSAITMLESDTTSYNRDNPCTCSMSVKYLDGVLQWVVTKPKGRYLLLKDLFKILRVHEMSKHTFSDTVVRVVGPDCPVWFREVVYGVFRDAVK